MSSNVSGGRLLRKFLVCVSAAAMAAVGASAWKASGESHNDFLEPYVNPTGAHRTHSTAGRIDMNNPFFQDLGTNGRTCFTCHRPESGWTVTPAGIRERFETTGGRDPIFRTNDGSNSPNADVSSVEARRSAYSMLLTKGLIRVGIGIPDGAEFTLESVDDPYGFASSHELSLFRRPPPSSNLTFLSTVMLDGRETFPGKTVDFDLLDQANAATMGHAQGIPLSTQQRRDIVDFETGLFTAQVYDVAAGDLGTQGAKGGPKNLSKQEFYIGINDPLGLNPSGALFTPVVFTNFTAWARLKSSHGGDDDEDDEGRKTEARRAVARGEDLFNTRRINITGVKGLNDDLGVAVIPGTCTTCHDTPNVGDHSVAAPLDIGLTDASRRTPDMPLYTLRNKATGETVQHDRPGPCPRDGQVEAHRALQGADPARPRRASALLPQRVGRHADRRREVLRRALRPGPHGTGDLGPRRVPAGALRKRPA